MKRLVSTVLILLVAIGCLLPDARADGAPEDIAQEATETPAPTETLATAEPTAEPTTEPTAEPTAAPTAEPTAEPTTEPTAIPVTDEPAAEAVSLRIDDANIYEGMDRAYKDGYVPQVADGTVTLVLPLTASGKVRGDKITVTPNLGDAGVCPIQYRNYQKTFALTENTVTIPTRTVTAYLVRFDFPLRDDRQNGTYPIVLDVRAADVYGAPIQQSYTCYVTITDGPAPVDETPVYGGGGVPATDVPMSDPRVLVSRYKVDPSPVMAGEDFTVTVTLKNTSGEEAVQNMLVTVTGESGDLVLKNDTSTIFLGDLAAGGTTELKLKYGTNRDTPARRYDIALAMEFDDAEAVTMSSNGSVTVAVAQPVQVELAPFTMPSEMNAGETVQLSFQVMNLGRTEIYNARVELDVPGLSPSGNAFIGNMDPGTSATETLNVFAGMKEGDERYGYTSGVARLIYEDVDGQEYTQEVNTTTNVKELVIATKDPAAEQEQADKARSQKIQWWVFVAAGGVVIIALALILGLRKRSAGSARHVQQK